MQQYTLKVVILQCLNQAVKKKKNKMTFSGLQRSRCHCSLALALHQRLQTLLKSHGSIQFLGPLLKSSGSCFITGGSADNHLHLQKLITDSQELLLPGSWRRRQMNMDIHGDRKSSVDPSSELINFLSQNVRH